MDAPANLSRPTCALLVDDNVDKLINMSSEIESLGIPVVMMKPASARFLLERNKCSKCNAQFSLEKDYAMHQCKKRCRVEEPSASHSKQHKKQRDEHQETSLKAENLKLERALREVIAVPNIIALGSTSSKMFEELGCTPTALVVDLDSAGIMQQITMQNQ